MSDAFKDVRLESSDIFIASPPYEIRDFTTKEGEYYKDKEGNIWFRPQTKGISDE